MNRDELRGEMIDILDDGRSDHITSVDLADKILDLLPTWTKVEDGLPEGGQSVLIYVKGYMVTKGRLYNDWQSESGYEWYDRERVTHWMPLPAPPD